MLAPPRLKGPSAPDAMVRVMPSTMSATKVKSRPWVPVPKRGTGSPVMAAEMKRRMAMSGR